ncbi:hypothetical protein EJ04DRAFT_572466 [Polyplosphaeria fusca]|uniref:Uncharacterized protein n=1 Tax=Polyplosphaeria fusca TaxID=682080 RepID=A0A9P4R776_9PLEO|nr:hypothetical protein EJ04DRAFT_572466 [Polyplosphaeria fusca]
MEPFNFESFDKHIANLQSQLKFVAAALNSTDHNAPDWVATDLLGLRNSTSRLKDDMDRVKRKFEEDGVTIGKASSSKRLSLKGSMHSSPVAPNGTAASSSAGPPGTKPSDRPAVDDSYEVQYMDISEMVQQRLNQSRLQRLMDSPRTAQKRKRDALQDEAAETENGEQDDTESESKSRGASPTKKLKACGTFEQLLKRREGDAGTDANEGNGGQRKRQRR